MAKSTDGDKSKAGADDAPAGSLIDPNAPPVEAPPELTPAAKAAARAALKAAAAGRSVTPESAPVAKAGSAKQPARICDENDRVAPGGAMKRFKLRAAHAPDLAPTPRYAIAATEAEARACYLEAIGLTTDHADKLFCKEMPD